MADPFSPQRVKALFFDVFGTLVDWRTSIARETEAILKPLGHDLDWLAFADAWRGEYQPAMDEVRDGAIPFCKLDVLHRRNLERILPRFGIAPPSEETLAQLNLAWHRLDAWSDVPPGLARLKRRFWLAPVSNGNISLMVDLARRNDFPGMPFSAPRSPATTSRSRASISPPARRSTSRPDECMMVAAHSRDLAAPRRSGCAPAMWRGRTSTAPARASRRPPYRSTSLRPAWSISPPGSGLERWPRRRPLITNRDVPRRPRVTTTRHD